MQRVLHDAAGVGGGEDRPIAARHQGAAHTKQIGLPQDTEQNKREELLDVSTCV